MKNYKHALITLLTVLAAGSTSAQSMNKDSEYYGEIGYTPISINASTVTLKPKLLRFIVGKDIDKNFSVEGMYAATASKDSYQSSDVSASAYGIYLKSKMEISKDTDVFARIGRVKSETKETWTGGSASSSSTDASYGLGVQTKFTKDVYGQIDYMSYYDKYSTTSKGFTVSVGMRF